MGWTTEKEEKLKELWKKGLTGSEIAKTFDTTRSAILGKVHRLKLEARAVSKKPLATPKAKLENDVEIKQEKLSKKARFRALLLDKNFEPENPKKLEELTDQTWRYPIGHPSEEASFYFCGRNLLKRKFIAAYI